MSTEKSKPDISDELRRLIRDRGITINELSRLAGVSRHKVGHWYSYRVHNLDVRVADALWVTLTGKGLASR